MPYGFFTQLHFRTRDSILDGAMEAGRILEQGVDEKIYRTPSIDKVEAEGLLGAAGLPAPVGTSREHGPSTPTGPPRKSSPPQPGTTRQSRRTAKTEAMFDVDRNPEP